MLIEFLVYYLVKIFGIILRVMPVRLALIIGNIVGVFAYSVGFKRRKQVYANLKMAFADTKSPEEIKRITKEAFKNYGKNLVDLMRMPLLDSNVFEKSAKVEGKEHIESALNDGKGVILLTMHFGAWEVASSLCSLMGFPYNVMVNPQSKYSRLDKLLNSYRSFKNSVVLPRGSGTRELIRNLRNNEVVGLVADQGGKEGKLVSFLGRTASLPIGAIRLGLKFGVAICFSVIVREGDTKRRVIFDKPLELDRTGNSEQDIVSGLNKLSKRMEEYVRKYPSEYMWFYKVWKYSNETNIVILNDGKVGHLRQSQAFSEMIKKALSERNIKASIKTVNVSFSDKFSCKLFSLFGALAYPLISLNKIGFLRRFLSKESFDEIASLKTDFVVSCGSTISGINSFLSFDHNAKSVNILKPALWNFNKFDLIVAPYHDYADKNNKNEKLVLTYAAPNLIDDSYLKEQSDLLLNRFSHLKDNLRKKVGLFIGGDSKDVYLDEQQIRILIHQIKDICSQISADILVTTSRRTPTKIEKLLQKELSKESICPLLILANQKNVEEAVGGILGLSDIVITSGDSISMISEAASSGNKTIVFPPKYKQKMFDGPNKHKQFIKRLESESFIVTSDVKNMGQTVCDVAKNKIITKVINDKQVMLDAARDII
ncbi:MAG: ELM1/GtrOC1 family putative glycosyltransferase [Candidatus Zapsychrus exili]|nr:ELM1/GtrOC1 family putative glycosyltransferase [Candidatus Zapsychrus exili]